LYTLKSQDNKAKVYAINWLEPLAVGPEKLQKQIYFEGADFDAENPTVPKFCSKAPANFSKSRGLVLTNLKWEAIPSNQLGAFSQYSFAAQIEIELGRGFSREAGPQLSFCFYPFALRNGVKSRLVSFSLESSAEVLPSLEESVSYSKKLNNSLLDSEGWHKLSVAETGIYKITPSFLTNNNISSSEVAISEIRVAGNGGGMLAEAFSANRPVDIVEQALKVTDVNGDGLFNGNDYILFYAQGPHTFSYNSGGDRYDYAHNIYRDLNYYFINVNGGGKSPSPQASLSNPQQQVNAFDDFAAVEDDNVNLVGTGRQWFGDVFEFTLSYNYSFNFPNVITNEPVKLLVDVVGRSSSNNTVINTRYANQQILSNSIPAYQTFGDYPNFVERSQQRTSFLPQGANITLNLSYDNSANPSAVAWLDRVVLNVRRQLSFAGIANSLQFRDSRSVAAGNRIEYSISQPPPNLFIWDVTDVANIAEISGSYQTDGSYSFVADASSLKEYVAFTGSNFNTPTYVEAIEAQNLHGMPIPEMIVISHSNFLPAAEDLAAFHTDQENVASSVVSLEQVYNEYGSGGADITAIRDFIKDLYDRSTNNRFKYVLLFGDASYDYKDRLSGNTNYIPTYQSSFSFSLGSSFITDDYFAYMNVGEAINFNGAVMDLGLGRIPVETLSQAQSYVDKIKRYVAGQDRFGDWRNRILLMADDVDELWERSYFVPNSESLEARAKATSGSYNVEKIYLDAYQQQTTTGSQSYPEARRDMYRKVQRGCLLTNYIGHGGEIGLASERLLQLADVTSWSNKDALSLFLTITCEFTRFDDPKRVSAGEQLLLNPNGGAIALLSTTRVVGVQGAVDLNSAIFDTILVRPDGNPQTLGQIIRAAKNDSYVIGRSTKTKFSLIGDPALRLAVPYYKVNTSTLNGKPINAALQDTAKALSLVQITGEVADLNGLKLSDFDGVLSVSVFDKVAQRQTLVNDGVGSPVGFKDQSSLIYRGKVQVSKGDFSFEFRVPLGINYQFGNGRISYYAFDAQERDASGYYDSIVVGGYNENAPIDNIGPEIELFMNDASFVRGGITGESPFIYARLTDSAGINTVGNGVGQDLRAVLNNKTDQPYILNEFYEADLNSYRSGEVRYQLFDLDPGDYTIEMRAFDIYNNPTEVSTDFVVAESADLALKRVLNYPNPFTTYTEFQFEHNRANQNLEVQVQIFTVSGKLVKTINQEINSLGNRVTGIKWDGLDDYGDKIGKGVYIYRLKVRSQLDNSQADEYEKLVILR
tara:strand:+ start:5240 stop:9043 length:3804 start_codon:yes stop_codon:yes gene_type:complete